MAADMEKSGITIREAVAGDVQLIHRFIKELAAFEKLTREVVATEKTLSETLFGKRAYAHVLIAEIEEEPVGFSVYYYNYSTFIGRPGLYIEDLFVRTDKRGLGIGKALFSHCARIARDNNCGRLEFAVLDWNPARSFYEQMGAQPMHDWVIYRLTGTALEVAANL
jgi:GNAT superfamily N-acetyltransferase